MNLFRTKKINKRLLTACKQYCLAPAHAGQHKATSPTRKPMKRNPFYGKLLRSSSSRPFPRLCVPSVALNPISLTNADCIHHAFEEIGLIKKSFPFSEINFPKIKFFYELRQAPPIRCDSEKKSQ